MRALQFLAYAIALGFLLVPLFRRHERGVAGVTDELVKDPVCQTYVARSTAVTRRGPEGPRYFCSDACASRAE
jgi:hypothetical protein